MPAQRLQAAWAPLVSFFRNRHLLSLGSSVANTLLSFVSYFLVVRLLAPGELGAWAFFLTVFGTLDALRTFVVETALIKYISGAPHAEARRLAGSAWAIMLAITAALAAASALALPWAGHWPGSAWPLALGWAWAGLAAALPYNLALWLLQVEQRFERILFLRLLSVLVFMALMGLQYWLGDLDSQRLVWCHMAGLGACSAAALAFGWARPAAMAHANWATAKKILHFGKFSMWTGVGATLLKNSDNFLVGMLLGPAALAVYYLPQKAFELVEIPLRSMAATAAPAMSAAANRGQLAQVAASLVRYAGFLTVAMLPAVAAGLLLADAYVLFFGGGAYAATSAAAILRIFLLFSILFPIDRFLGMSLDLIGRPELNMAKVFAMLAVNVVGDVLAIRFFGNVLAVAWVSVATFSVGALVGHLLLRRHLAYRFGAFFAQGLAEARLQAARLRALFAKKAVGEEL